MGSVFQQLSLSATSTLPVIQSHGIFIDSKKLLHDIAYVPVFD